MLSVSALHPSLPTRDSITLPRFGQVGFGILCVRTGLNWIPQPPPSLSHVFLPLSPPLSPLPPPSLPPFRHYTGLATFDGGAGARQWQLTNDPVMGGQSVSTYKIANDSMIFDGSCAIVPSLKAPGFCNVRGESGAVDISNSTTGAMYIYARTSTPEYQGYRVAFGGQGIPKTSIFGGVWCSF
jgi:hypothetical protein